MPAEGHSTAPSTRAFRPALLWLLVPVLALVELGGQRVIVARVAPKDDWRRAAELVRENRRPRDLVTSAPGWTDPILREMAGDMISLADAGRSDTAAYDRIWVLSVRGARSPEAPDRDPDFERDFGRVRVERWQLPPSTVLYDLVEHVDEGRAAIVEDGQEQSCPLRTQAVLGGVGLDRGPIKPGSIFACDPRRDWLWIGATVFEDSEHRARRCVWQHPAGHDPIRVTLPDVPLGDRIVLYGGLHRDQAFDDHRGTVHVSVSVDGEPVGELNHPAGPGWSRMEARTQSAGARRERGAVTIDVTADDPEWRHFCWSATTQRDAAGVREAAR